MSSYLLKNIQINDPRSPYHLQVGDLGIKEGKIEAFSPSIPDFDYEQIFDFNGCFVSSAFVDLRCNSSDLFGFRFTADHWDDSLLARGYLGPKINCQRCALRFNASVLKMQSSDHAKFDSLNHWGVIHR